MKKLLFVSLAALLVMGGSGLFAQSDTVNLAVNLQAWYNLNIDTATVTFTESVAPTPGATPPTADVAGSPASINVAAFAVCSSGQTLNLNVTAPDLTAAGGLTIGVGAISWTVTGSGYSAGAMSNGGTLAGSWSGSILHYHTGTFSYKFVRNFNTQAPGAYTATATYTLSAT